MIDIRARNTILRADERRMAEELEKGGIPFTYGDVRAGQELHRGVFITREYAVSFKPYSPGIENHFRQNRITPQVWKGGELSWAALALSKRLALHK